MKRIPEVPYDADRSVGLAAWRPEEQAVGLFGLERTAELNARRLVRVARWRVRLGGWLRALAWLADRGVGA